MRIFFFQAEDGIRGFHVTGVQTCALPISAVSIDGVRFGKGHAFFDLEWGMFTDLGLADEQSLIVRSEERRVGKECRSRRSEDHCKIRDEDIEAHKTCD